MQRRATRVRAIGVTIFLALVVVGAVFIASRTWPRRNSHPVVLSLPADFTGLVELRRSLRDSVELGMDTDGRLLVPVPSSGVVKVGKVEWLVRGGASGAGAAIGRYPDGSEIPHVDDCPVNSAEGPRAVFEVSASGLEVPLESFFFLVGTCRDLLEVRDVVRDGGVSAGGLKAGALSR